MSYRERFALDFCRESLRREICGIPAVLHCHHYNARIQGTIEGASQIDGHKIILSSAEAAFDTQIRAALRDDDGSATRLRVAEQLYAHLGYGTIDLSQVAADIVTQSASHFVEGWRAGFPERNTPVCSLTAGYIQAAIHVATGETVDVSEEHCIIQDAPANQNAPASAKQPECRFVIDRSRTEPFTLIAKAPFRGTLEPRLPSVPSNVDEAKVIDSLIDLPIEGGDDGLIQAFNVYLANTPANFYNYACIQYVAEMERVGLGRLARKLLAFDSEMCALNTFQGILRSEEWEMLIAPMIREPRDTLLGVIAVANSMGLGALSVTDYSPGQRMSLSIVDSYEGVGYSQIRSEPLAPACHMLSGAAAGFLALVDGEGPVLERAGQYIATQTHCVACNDTGCQIDAVAAD